MKDNEKEDPDWKSKWGETIFIGTIVAFVLNLIINSRPDNRDLIFILHNSYAVCLYSTFLILARRCKKPTRGDTNLMKFGLVLYFLILLIAFKLTEP